MPTPTIEGFAVISGSRIILPVEIATVDPSVTFPSIATIGTIQFANISIGTVEVGTISIVVVTDYVGTIGTVLGGNIDRVGTIVSQANIAVASLVGSIASPVSVAPIPSLATLGTIQSGNVVSSISGGQLSVVGTIGTIQSPVGIVIKQPASYVFTSVSATIKASPGILYLINASGESGLTAGPGTLLVLDSTSTIAVIPVAAGGFVTAPFGPGVSFSTLIGSIIGSVDATFVIR